MHSLDDPPTAAAVIVLAAARKIVHRVVGFLLCVEQSVPRLTMCAEMAQGHSHPAKKKKKHQQTKPANQTNE